jgi:ABC-type molybdate transport system substrate-binding protein
MKTYIPVVIGLLIILSGGYMYSKKNTTAPVKEETVVKTETTAMSTFEGEVTRMSNGENKLAYSLSIPETATTNVEMNNALLRVTNGTTPYATVYMSFEGARKYTPEKYFNNVIVPHVSVVTPSGEQMIGNTMWYQAESEASQWHIASVNDGKWLVIVENRKAAKDMVEKTLSSFTVK